MQFMLSSPLIIVLCTMIGLQIFIMFIEPHKRYQQYIHKKKLQQLFGELHYQKVLHNKDRVSEKVNDIPIVNLLTETLSQAEELLEIEVEPVCFEDEVIQAELPFIFSTLPEYSKKKITLLTQENQLPLRVHYKSRSRGVDNFQTDIDMFSHKKYFTITEFYVSELISTSFVEELLKKDIILLGICGIYSSFDTIVLLLLPFQKERDENATHIKNPLPAYPELVS